MTPFFKPDLQLKFTPTGKWDEATRILGRLDSSIKIAAVRAQEEVAKRILKKVKSHLLKQDLPWPALSKEWKSRKRKAGADTRMLLATHSYYDNIMMWKRANGWQVFMGVKPGIYGKTIDGKRAKRDIATIAAINEFSRKRGLRRPLWNPTIREMGNTQGIKTLYLDHFEKQLRALGLKQYIIRLKKF